jgi:glutamine amidotransferase
MSDVLIVDSGGANLASLRYALARLGAGCEVSRDARTISSARRVILPGVGSAADAMQRLLEARLVPVLAALRQPVLGICLGMQLLFSSSAEGPAECLGLMPGIALRLAPLAGHPVPHMGWNQLELRRADPLLTGIAPQTYVYFVHSYAVAVAAHTVASVTYGAPLAAVVRHENFWGTQFHPERSGAAGARVLQNFLELS